MSFLIADSGSTKTDWIEIGPGLEHRQFRTAGINPFYQTAEEIKAVLNKELLPDVTANREQIYFYGAGCADERTSRPVFDALTSCFPNANGIEIASDMLGAARGLCGHEAGLACILGTGANNAFFDGEKIVHSIGSLGFWLGDEGSGSYLGKTLMVHYLQNELPEDLHHAFATKYPEINRLSVLDNAYKKPYPNRFFASFTTFLSEHIQHPFLIMLVGNAFDIFIKKYVTKHQNARKHPIHFTGSVSFYFQDILKSRLDKSGLTAGQILKSPLEGLVKYYL